MLVNKFLSQIWVFPTCEGGGRQANWCVASSGAHKAHGNALRVAMAVHATHEGADWYQPPSNAVLDSHTTKPAEEIDVL